MALAALIISSICLVQLVVLTSLFIAKNYFSTHVVQLQPVDAFLGESVPDLGRPMADPFREVSDQPSDDEMEFLKPSRKG